MMEPLENPSPNARALIIEDDEEMRSLLKDFFVEEGCETDSVSNGYEALEILIKKRFDLIMTDIRMPGLTGLDILPRIKKLQPGVPIIVITAFGSEEVHRRAYERGATVYLEKPIHFEKLRELIHQMVVSRHAPPSPVERGEGEGGSRG
jgi:DNA-binding NtrC family response regulator